MRVNLNSNVMKKQKIYIRMFLLIGLLILTTNVFAQDPNFHIYLCFGQSNMEGQGTIEQQDKTVDSRFQVMEAVNCSNLGRTKGNWYPAIPPLCRCWSGLSPADYFGRTMVKNLPDSIKVGVINVSVAGCKIELFDKDNYQDYVSTVTEDWLKNIINEYGGNPYGHLIETAKLAQQDGVIKGILLHQGESNTGDTQWPSKVKVVYDNLINDLDLDPDLVPLLAGEVVHADQGGICASMNSIIAKLPQTVPNSYVISSSGCTDAADNLHFNSAGYRQLGTRYAIKMLSLLGYDSNTGEPGDSSEKWVGTWSTAPYAAGNNTPPSPYLANNTLRQIVRISIGGDTLRVKFSNRTSSTPVTMNSVNIAVSTNRSTSVIDASTIKQLKFNGNESVTMNAYSEVTSDPVAFPLTPNMNLAITIYYGQIETASDMTFHYGSRTDSYILTGDHTASADFAGAVTVERWYNLSSIDVLVQNESAAVAVLGNSITDGYGIHGGQNKWTDTFSEKLLDNPSTSHVSVLNLGIGATWLTTSGVSRFQQDILEQPGLQWIIVFYGVNDIGGNSSADNIINAYKSLIAQAHAQNIRIYGATITPFKGHGYYTAAREAVRNEVNEWIRTPGNFDRCIDFDKAIRDPADTSKLHADFSNDWLHPNAAGYQMLGESVDLNFFLGADTLYEQPEIESHYFEPECAAIGNNWEIITDGSASNETYITVKTGLNSTSNAPADVESIFTIPFTVNSNGVYSVFARLNCPTYDDDSFWVKINDGEFVMYNGLVTSGWEWKSFGDYTLTEGEHTLTIAYREDGAKLDKISISNSSSAPTEMGEEAENICDLTEVENLKEVPDGFSLGQNYPNPFNPSTMINYQLPAGSHVQLKVYDSLGKEVSTLVNEYKPAGKYNVSLHDFSSQLSSGIYFYTLRAGDFIQTKKMAFIK